MATGVTDDTTSYTNEELSKAWKWAASTGCPDYGPKAWKAARATARACELRMFDKTGCLYVYDENDVWIGTRTERPKPLSADEISKIEYAVANAKGNS